MGCLFAQLFRRNHPSWEDDPYAQEVLILVLSEWFNAGSLEYVERFHRLPHCILAVGAVPKNTHPFRRLVTDGRPINIYAEGWRVKYATVGDICLMLTRCSLIWVRSGPRLEECLSLGATGRLQRTDAEAAALDHQRRRHRLRPRADIPLGMRTRGLPRHLRQIHVRLLRSRARGVVRGGAARAQGIERPALGRYQCRVHLRVARPRSQFRQFRRRHSELNCR